MKNRHIWTWPALAIVLVALWQWATVTANFSGNWSALYCTGSLQRLPPLVKAEHTYIFANSTGYDGQFYHYAAHDPFLRSGLKTYVDEPAIRYERILIPLLAWLLAIGNPGWIDPAYVVVEIAFIALGVYWSCRLVQAAKLRAEWGLLFLLVPAIPISADRLVVDGSLAALTVAFLLYQRSPGKLFLVLACAALARETGFLLIAAAVAYRLCRRELRSAGLLLVSAVPAAGWYWFVQAHCTAVSPDLNISPLLPIVLAFAHPWSYPSGTPLVGAVIVADYLALAGLVLALVLGIVSAIRKPASPAQFAAAAFAFTGIFLAVPATLTSVYHFGRLYTPLLLCLAAIAARDRKPWLLAPIALMLPRIGVQFTPQLLGIVHRIL